MQNDSNFTPLKQWEQTSTGYYIVPLSELNVKGASTDDQGRPLLEAMSKTIVRTTCPDCSDTRKHSKEPCVRLDMTTVLGKCYNCGFRFIIDTKVAAYNKKSGYQKKNYRKPDTTKLLSLDGVAFE